MEQADGRHFLVMELVEGETLADRLRRGAMPVEDTLAIALQIAEALEAAHEKSVVHRDLKPANVKITPDENVKVLDFGLAKVMEIDRTGGSQGDSPTLSMMASQAGIILGTAAYMSPEQAKGLPADHRSDVFSFGVVLYEMLTGRQPFQGETAPDVLASVLVRDADLSRLGPDFNPRVADLIRRCLEKSPRRRWQAIGDLRSEIEAIAAAPKTTAMLPVALPPRPLWRRAIPVALTAIVAGALSGAAGWSLRPLPVPAVTRFLFLLPEGQTLTAPGRHSVTVSPDGALIAYVANSRLYLKPMSQLEGKPIQGTESFQSVTSPVFSPDGQSIAFWALSDGTLKKIAVRGGAAVTICPAANPFGLSWGPEGIVFGQGGGGVRRVSSDGGQPESIVTAKADEFAQSPEMLPGGTHVLFTLATGTASDRWEKSLVVAQSLASQERTTLVAAGTDARYIRTGHLVYALGGTLFAVTFDARGLKVTSGPVPVVEGVRRPPATVTGAADFRVSNTGSLVYVPGPASTSSAHVTLGLTDRKGVVEMLKLPLGAYEVPRASPDGRHIAFGTSDTKEAIVWTYDMAGATAMQRRTFGSNNRFPLWSHDGTRLAFQSDREGDLAIFWQKADGTGPVERLTKPAPGEAHAPESWSPKGETLLFSSTKGSDISLWTLTLPERKTAPFGAVTSTMPNDAVFSPDGQWVAYSSNETGRTALYVQPFPATGAKYQLFAGDAGGPHHQMWSRDGKELFYNPRPGVFEAVGVTTSPTFSFGNPVAVPRPFLGRPPTVRRPLDMTPGGKFLALFSLAQSEGGASPVPEIRVVLNWFEELKQRVPVR